MTKNFPSVMLDLETMGVKPDTMVLSIAAVAFDEFDDITTYNEFQYLDLLLSTEEQAHRSIDKETEWWWNQRAPEVRAKIFGDEGRVSVDDALDQLIKFCWQKNRIWCQGPTLDITVLTNLFGERGKGVPWGYGIVRDSRTLLDLVAVDQPTATHDSIEDCIRQIVGVQQAIKKLGVTRFVKGK
jgi:hypothetical protein